MGKHAPSTAAAQNIEDGIEHRPEVCGSRSAPRLGSRQQATDDMPFGVTEVTWVSHRRTLARLLDLSKHPLNSRGEESRNLFLAFLSTADSLARQVGEIVPHGQKRPILSVSELWMPPMDLLEVSPAKGVDVIPAPLPPEQLEILKARRAPTRYSPSVLRR